MSIIMGIDPGTKITGFGIIKKERTLLKVLNYGCVKTSPSLPLENRYLIIYETIEQLIKKYSPSFLAIESQFVKKNAQSALKLGMAKGVIMLAGAKNNIPIYHYAPTKVKLASTGVGFDSKSRIKKLIPLLLQIPQKDIPEDVADALAVAICHSNTLNSLGESHV